MHTVAIAPAVSTHLRHIFPSSLRGGSFATAGTPKTTTLTVSTTPRCADASLEGGPKSLKTDRGTQSLRDAPRRTTRPANGFGQAEYGRSCCDAVLGAGDRSLLPMSREEDFGEIRRNID